jgi:hypothetical protein
LKLLFEDYLDSVISDDVKDGSSKKSSKKSSIFSEIESARAKVDTIHNFDKEVFDNDR